MLYSIAYYMTVSLFLAIVFSAGWALSVHTYADLPVFQPLEVLGITLIIYVLRNVFSPSIRNIVMPPIVLPGLKKDE